MRAALPVQAIQGHLVWGPDGSVWACNWVEPFGYPHRSIRDAHEIPPAGCGLISGTSDFGGV
jgi:hypothetical protein